METRELIGALAWLITALSPDNAQADEILAILQEKEDMQHIVKLYKESLLETRFFPE